MDEGFFVIRIGFKPMTYCLAYHYSFHYNNHWRLFLWSGLSLHHVPFTEFRCLAYSLCVP
jgi:hypothetical protein